MYSSTPLIHAHDGPKPWYRASAAALISLAAILAIAPRMQADQLGSQMFTTSAVTTARPVSYQGIRSPAGMPQSQFFAGATQSTVNRAPMRLRAAEGPAGGGEDPTPPPSGPWQDPVAGVLAAAGVLLAFASVIGDSAVRDDYGFYGIVSFGLGALVSLTKTESGDKKASNQRSGMTNVTGALGNLPIKASVPGGAADPPQKGKATYFLPEVDSLFGEQPQFSKEVSDLPSVASLTAAEWRERYEKDYQVSLWMEDEFNAGSRVISGKDSGPGYGMGEGPSAGNVPIHNVKMTDRDGKLWDLQVPEDRYILWEAEDQGMKLPFACRVGCCTTCAVKIHKGVMVQEQALGIAPKYREEGYGLMCVGFPKSDLEMTLIEEDELYDKQFGEFFEKQATDPNSPYVLRDDFALEIADMDE